MKFVSWNVNGIRACVQKGFQDVFKELDADIFCIQESKMQEGQLDLETPGYYQYWNYAERKGYSGTAIFTKKEPLQVSYGMGIEEHDKEGRVITLEFEDIYFVTVYTPNSQSELARLSYRMEWEDAFLAYLKKLEEKKAASAKAKKEDAVIEKIIEGAQMEIPDAMVKTQAEQLVDDFAQRLQMQGLSMDQYMQFTGSTVDALVEQSKPQALKRIQSRLVLEAVAAAENLAATDEEVEAEYSRMAEQYKMEVEKLKEFMGDAEKQQMKEDMAVQEAVTFLAENAVEK